MSFFKIIIGFYLSLTVFILTSHNAFALRPFITTDADVVEKGKIELEFGYFGIKEEKNPGSDELREQQFSGTAAFLKKVWHWGEGFVPDFATETGLLFPTEKGGERIDFEGTGIFTWELKDVTFHTTIGGGTERKRRTKMLGDEEFEVEETRGVFIYGSILD